MRYLKFNPVFCLIIFLSILPGYSAAATIDFESLSDGDSVDTQYPGLTFSNATAISAGLSLNELEFPPRSGTNVIFDAGGPMTIDFTTPQLSAGAFFTYLDRITIEAFDSNNTLVVTITSAFLSNLALSGDAGSTPNEFMGFSGPTPFNRLVISGDTLGESFVLDDLSFTASVPLPGTLGLFGTGLVSLLGMRRRMLNTVDAVKRP